MKKYTKEQYYQYLKKLLPESNFNLDIFQGTEKPCEITCNICNTHHTFSCASTIARRARRNCKNVCKNCEINDWTKRQKESEYKGKYLLNKKKTIIPIEDLKSWASRNLILWHCTKCNHNFKRSPFVMFSQNSLNCPWCETRPFQYTKEIIETKSKDLWGQEYTILDYKKALNKNGSKRILVSHNNCGFKYSVSLWNFLHGSGCPKCKSSHGEKKVRKYLILHNFYFLEQYPIKVKNTTLKLDFYLEENNKKYAIEYNGIQHYQPVEFFGGEKAFKKQILRDKLKKEYCLNNNIELIVIPYNNEQLINSEELAQRLNNQVI